MSDIVSIIAHELTGAYASVCCHKTGGKDPDRDCVCRDMAERLLESDAGTVKALFEHFANLHPEFLRSSLSTARSEGIREGLEMAAKVIDEGYDRNIGPRDKTCAHDRWSHEDCDICAAAAIRAKIEEVKP